MTTRLPSDLVPAARDLIGGLADATTTPVKVLIAGGVGTGKSSTLASVRTALRAAGLDVHSRSAAGQGAVVVDDAHLLDDAELAQLATDVADPRRTVVVAAELRLHRAPLRGLVTALEREMPPVRLGELAGAEVARELAGTLGQPPTPELVRAVMAATAGLPFLVRAAHVTLGQAPDTPDPAAVVGRAARAALVERLRRAEVPVLDTLLITSLHPTLGPDDVAAALEIPADQAQARVGAARASGLLEPSYSASFLATVHAAAAQVLGTARHHDVERSLLRSQLDLSTLSSELALRIGEHGLRDDRLAVALAGLARRSQENPAEAARLYRAAAEAGGAGPRAPLADALALTGDFAAAARLADDLLTADDPGERAAAVRIAASLALQEGNAGQAAELFRWLGPNPDPHVGSAAAVVAVAAGDVDAARSAQRAESVGPPTSTARAARALGEGLLLSLDQPFGTALARLSQAISADSALLTTPDTPAALVTLAALHGGDPVRARSVISRALSTHTSAEPMFGERHRLLLAWIKMQDGQLGSAANDLADAKSACRRDALWAAAARTGIARRAGDGGAMQKHWYAAMEVLAEYSIDLFTLLPLGEIWMAAARLRQVDQLRHTLNQAFDLLTACGNPVLWSVPLHWAGVHAGILANAPTAVAPHGQALAAASPRSAVAVTLASAGRTWLKVLANQVDADEVTAAARALSQSGLTWDATRLASQAALHAADGRVSGAMLQVARDLKLTAVGDTVAISPDDAGHTAAPTPVTSSPRSRAPQLSEREREVAELLLLGLPYRDIGAQLFISAKTVEHHVARIRRRLGAESRSEMLSMLRTLLTSEK